DFSERAQKIIARDGLDIAFAQTLPLKRGEKFLLIGEVLDRKPPRPRAVHIRIAQKFLIALWRLAFDEIRPDSDMRDPDPVANIPQMRDQIGMGRLLAAHAHE